jgi:hypothetical protein
MKSGARKFFKRAILTTAFAAATLGFYSYEVEPNILKTTTYDIETAKWKADPPLHLVMASDFHVGCPSVDLKRLGEIVDRINALKPDIIVLPGDFVTMTQGEWRVIGGKYVAPQPIADVLKGLKAPLGVYAVLGNHDDMNDPEGMRAALESAGIRVIDNNAIEIRKNGYDFWIAGLADDSTGKPDWKGTSAKITNDAPVVLLMHDPAAFLDVDGRPAVSLAGHTHGGQVVIPFFEKYLKNPFSRAPMKYLYGHVDDNGRDIIVTSGIGTSIVPLRFDAPPEIVSLELKPASAAAPPVIAAQPKVPPAKPAGPA